MRIATRGGYPVLSRAGESTVGGLYFVGAPAAFGLGPSMRFIAGTHNVARQLTRSLAHRAKKSSFRSARLESADQDVNLGDDDPVFQESA